MYVLSCIVKAKKNNVLFELLYVTDIFFSFSERWQSALFPSFMLCFRLLFAIGCIESRHDVTFTIDWALNITHE